VGLTWEDLTLNKIHKTAHSIYADYWNIFDATDRLHVYTTIYPGHTGSSWEEIAKNFESTYTSIYKYTA
jgi:hypothetical protein